MKGLSLFLFTLLLPEISRSKNIPACDSLLIECCSFGVKQNTVTLIASNYSSYLFDYPGFILYNSNMDTVAIETVNYFGIGTEQPHSLNIIHPFELPFEGILELYVLFYDSLTCTFEVTIPDTITAGATNHEFKGLKIFPNPAESLVYIEFGSSGYSKDIDLRIVNILGQEMYKCRLTASGIQIPACSIGESGLYFIQITDQPGKIIETSKLLLR